jgi:hypothetical protein
LKKYNKPLNAMMRNEFKKCLAFNPQELDAFFRHDDKKTQNHYFMMTQTQETH